MGLYVHLPWCVSKCPYCDFNSHALRGELPEERYRRALLSDLRDEMSVPGIVSVGSVFFGGGTPSLFSARTIEVVLRTLADAGVLADSAEVTLEANPGTVERGSFRDYAAAGVNRVSLGVQSFSASALARLGRIHSPAEVWGAIEDVRRAGIPRLNLDLMYGLPEQTVAEALEDLDQALTASPEHLSQYQLTLEPNTLFHARPPSLPTDEDVWDAFEACHARLADSGYRRYEVSAYAMPGHECRHNLNYWEFGDYVGIGAGAHGKRSDAREGRVVRSSKMKHPDSYMRARPPVQEVTEVTGNDRVFEFMLNALRLTGGFGEAMFEARTGVSADHIRSPLSEAESRGLICRRKPSGWQPTDRGMRFLNDLQSLFLPEADQ
jgi:putative oxygen-independent coproporphyrinogen III oxidase